MARMYHVTLMAHVEAESLRDAVEIAKDHAMLDADKVQVISTMVNGEDGRPQIVQWGDND